MKRVVEQLKKNNRKAVFVLQLTSMVDMFTIMIVFLLKSYSTSAVHITPHEGLRLPSSTSYTDPTDSLKIVVSKKGLFVDDTQIVSLENDQFKKQDLDPNDSDFIKPFYEALDREATKVKSLAKQNEAVEFEGKVILQADSSLPYSLLRKVMYTSSLAGFADMRLATIAVE